MRRRITQSDLAEGVIDALTSHICVLDAEGTIIALNRAWTQFWEENSPKGARSDIGINYLDVCGMANTPASAFSKVAFAMLRPSREPEFAAASGPYRPTPGPLSLPSGD